MTKKAIIGIAAIALLATMAGSCSRDNKFGSDDMPDYLIEGNDERPQWVCPDLSHYPNLMTVQVQLGDILVDYQTGKDLIGAFIEGEIAGMTGPSSTGGVIYYPLSIGSDDASGTVKLQYYCDSLHRIFSINEWASFDPSAKPTGESGIYRPRFTDNWGK